MKAIAKIRKDDQPRGSAKIRDLCRVAAWVDWQASNEAG